MRIVSLYVEVLTFLEMSRLWLLFDGFTIPIPPSRAGRLRRSLVIVGPSTTQDMLAQL